MSIQGLPQVLYCFSAELFSIETPTPLARISIEMILGAETQKSMGDIDALIMTAGQGSSAVLSALQRSAGRWH
jgi:hypothetical protein